MFAGLDKPLSTMQNLIEGEEKANTAIPLFPP
jgi:hypothetical protein